MVQNEPIACSVIGIFNSFYSIPPIERQAHLYVQTENWGRLKYNDDTYPIQLPTCFPARCSLIHLQEGKKKKEKKRKRKKEKEKEKEKNRKVELWISY